MSAGIYNEEAKKNYLRYCEEYHTAWIEYLPEISETIRKFHGKKVTKRIATAIKNINSNFGLDIERSFSGAWLTLRYYDLDKRIFKDEATGEWDYVRNSDHEITTYKTNDYECFDAEEFVEYLKKLADNMIADKDDVYDALDKLDEIKAEYNKALEAFKEARVNIPHAIKDLYKISNYHIGYWN